MTGRYVIVSEPLGVWLGDYRWSKRNPSGFTTAPTYDGRETAEMLELLNKTGTGLQLTAHLVTPSVGTSATEQDCVSAGLTGWSPPAVENRS